MTEIGYALSCEEHGPADLVRYGGLAEELGFPYALISDHYHPWTDRQGHSPFVWSVIGGLAQVTERLRIGTGVTWTGELVEHRGRHYTVENARIYTLPEAPIPVMVAAAGPVAAELAGRIGDGFIGVAPEQELVDRFERSGGAGKPRYGQITVCYAQDEREARRTAHEWWPNIGLSGELSQVLPQPAHFEQAVANVSEDDVGELVACGPDVDRHVEFIQRFAGAGYDHVYVHQVGPDQEGFLRFYAREILPRVHGPAATPVQR